MVPFSEIIFEIIALTIRENGGLFFKFIAFLRKICYNLLLFSVFLASIYNTVSTLLYNDFPVFIIFL